MVIRKTRFLFWLIALAVVMACVPTFAAPSIPTIDPNAIGTIIVQTSNAAATQTVAAQPTSTSTPTFTPTPRFTDTPEPTATSTVIFIFFTPTSKAPTLQPTTTSGSGTSSKQFACDILSVNPPNGTTYNNRVDFDAKWKVKNIGKSAWDKDSVDYHYLGGNKFHKVSGYDLGKTVNVGETVELIVDMLSPKNPGTYTTNWTLQAGDVKFCKLSLTIVVQ